MFLHLSVILFGGGWLWAWGVPLKSGGCTHPWTHTHATPPHYGQRISMLGLRPYIQVLCYGERAGGTDPTWLLSLIFVAVV